ncbi:hypothetical protein, partial [Akkermansia sp.]|uniref:hypothetical protein n=1 Tax=Akkermansia sp. TaxID=1872421 RepID=UPI0025B7B405
AEFFRPQANGDLVKEKTASNHQRQDGPFPPNLHGSGRMATARATEGWAFFLLAFFRRKSSFSMKEASSRRRISR